MSVRKRISEAELQDVDSPEEPEDEPSAIEDTLAEELLAEGWSDETSDDDEVFGERPPLGDVSEPAPAGQIEDDDELIRQLDPRWRDDFEGLSYLGKLEREVEVAGHKFLIRTLKHGDKLAVTRLSKEYEASFGYAIPYRAAVVAAALIAVDGEPLTAANKQMPLIDQKFRWLLKNWYTPIIEAIYIKVDEMEGDVIKIMEALGVFQGMRMVATADGPVAGGIEEGPDPEPQPDAG